MHPRLIVGLQTSFLAQCFWNVLVLTPPLSVYPSMSSCAPSPRVPLTSSTRVHSPTLLPVLCSALPLPIHASSFSTIPACMSPVIYGPPKQTLT
ncbi:hypothetical protein BDN70DRAFT_873315 [Pholiota conissans]|uniref:Secreted protein n=1 Tax=Pholiota conissans TaxID=109636 RepID=A0A9P5ZAM1_9AGAR|nr:hypothetical protein BDN70DRAFT_873315 [Pholiota conissans]